MRIATHYQDECEAIELMGQRRAVPVSVDEFLANHFSV
jgi:hypothetical protein